MVKFRWYITDEGRDVLGLGTADGKKVVLQYSYRLPRHPGFLKQDGPNTGDVDQPGDKWSDWLTVDLPIEQQAYDSQPEKVNDSSTQVQHGGSATDTSSGDAVAGGLQREGGAVSGK